MGETTKKGYVFRPDNEELLTEIDKIAAQNKRNRRQEMEYILEMYVKSYTPPTEVEIQKTFEALDNFNKATTKKAAKTVLGIKGKDNDNYSTENIPANATN